MTRARNDNEFAPFASDGVAAVVGWWSEEARDLPWRKTRDPWLVLVSEVMSQQTQVDRVIPKWHAFIERFPTPADAARAPASVIISMWDGLGYNRRALMLHNCATKISTDHDGIVPNELDELLALPGIGPYTARAILAFAFEDDVGVLDTNVGRVLARVCGRALKPRDAQLVADMVVPVGKSWEWNQALLDFGAQICQKRTPRCSQCPVRGVCTWAGTGPDPAVGSAGVGVAQTKFVGSDRQGRGKLVSRLRAGPLRAESARDVMGFADDPDRSERVLASLLADGLVVSTGDELHLPE